MNTGQRARDRLRVERPTDVDASLFANLVNPTSNKIYQGIGDEPVADVVQYVFLD
jgi:hypothetical protein